MNVIEYGDGWRESLTIIPKEVEGKGWRKMIMEQRRLCGSAGNNEGKEYGGAETFKRKLSKDTVGE